MNLDEYAPIVPDEKIFQLAPFYVSGLGGECNLIYEELKSSEMFTEEMKCLWALEQCETAMKSLFVWTLIIPLEKGGSEIPVIAPKEHYILVFMHAKNGLMMDLEKTFKIRERFRDRLFAGVEQVEMQMEQLEQLILEPSKSQDPKDLQELAEKRKDWTETLEALQKSSEKDYMKWSQEQAKIQTDKQKVEDHESAIRLKALKQCREDSEALMRAQKALDSMKKYIQGLMIKVPSITGVVRKMGIDGVDPYTAGDLRRCYANMLLAFRKDDELGVATCLMGGMRLQQGANQSLRVFTRKVEEFHQAMILLGVKMITIGDLAAMVAIGGMNEKFRSAFLQAQTALALALEDLDETDGGSMGGGGDSGSEVRSLSGSSSRRTAARRNLLAKVLAFVDSEENRDLLTSRLGKQGGAQGGAQGGVTGNQSAADRQRAAENRAVMAVTEQPKGKCFRWERKGSCVYGDKCGFSHDFEPKVGAATVSAVTEKIVVDKKKVTMAPTYSVVDKDTRGIAVRTLFPLNRAGWSEDEDEDSA